MQTKLKELITAVGFTLGTCVFTAASAQASAITGLGGSIYGTGGTVSVDILASGSSFTNELEFFYAWTDASRNVIDKITLGLDNHLATINLGVLQEGQELIFGIQSPQGTFLIGDAGRNRDNIAHAWVTAAPLVAGFAESWKVGFEDLLHGGDRDFNDAILRVNQTAAHVPEPTSLALLAIGLVGLGLKRRTKRLEPKS